MAMSEHKMSWAAILIAIGAAGMAVAMVPALPAAIVLGATVLGAGATAAGYSISRGLAKQGSGDSSATPAPVAQPTPEPVAQKQP